MARNVAVAAPWRTVERLLLATSELVPAAEDLLELNQRALHTGIPVEEIRRVEQRVARAAKRARRWCEQLIEEANSGA